MSAIQSQAQLGSQISQTANVVAQTALQQSQENAKYFAELKSSLADAEYSKVYSSAMLDFTKAVNDRQNKILDDNGNPTFGTLTEDIGKIGNDIYNKYSTQASPLISGRFKQSFNNVITNRQAESFAETRKQANNWMLGQAQNSYDTLSNAAIAGTPSVSAESLLEFQKQLQGYVANGVIHPAQAADMEKNFKTTVGMVRGQNLIQADPQAVMLGTAPGTDDSYLKQNGIYLDEVKKQHLNLKAQQEVARRAQEAAAAQNAAVDTLKDTYTEMNKVIENGGRLDPASIENLKNQASGLGTPKANNLVKDINILAQKAHAISQFSTLSPEQRQQVLFEYERSGNMGTAYETLKRTNDNINNNLQKDPYAYAISQNTVQGYQPLDLNGDVRGQLAKRRQDAAQIQSRYGVESSGVTKQELDAISKKMNSMAPDQQAAFLGQVVGGMGSKSLVLFRDMAKNGDRQNALIGTLVLSGREDTASKVLQGLSAIKEDKNLGLNISSDDLKKYVNNVVQSNMPETVNSAYTNDVLSMARAIYAQKATAEKDYSGTFNLNRFRDAVTEAQGGKPITVLGRPTLGGLFTSSQSKIVPPVAGMDSDGFENWIKGIRDSDIQSLGGWKGFNSGMASQLTNAKLQQYGPGTYLVMLPSKASETGYTPVLNAATGEPFKLDYRQIMDNRTGGGPVKVQQQSRNNFDAKSFVNMVDFSVAASPQETQGVVAVADVSSFVQNAYQTHKEKLAPYSSAISNSASINNINENLIKSIILTESSGNAGAVSNKGARGLMQITDGAAKDVGIKQTGTPENNIAIGTKYIAFLLNKYKGNLDLALSAYNAGMGRVKGKVPNIKETKEYVQKVKGIYSKLQQRHN
jgi:hypothetical protein